MQREVHGVQAQDSGRSIATRWQPRAIWPPPSLTKGSTQVLVLLSAQLQRNMNGIMSTLALVGLGTRVGLLAEADGNKEHTLRSTRCSC